MGVFSQQLENSGFKQLKAKMPHGKAKQEAKGELAKAIVNWALNEPVNAKSEFQESAKEVLQFLAEIETKLA
jgi:hypothetical protein